MARAWKRSTSKRKAGTAWMLTWRDWECVGGEWIMRERTRTGFTDKAATLSLGAQLEDTARKRRDGLIDPAEERRIGHVRRPLDEHLDDFRAVLEAKGNTTEHVGRIVGAVRQAAGALDWETIGDVDAATLAEHVQTLRDGGMSVATINRRLAGIKAFSRWLAMHGRLAADPLASVRLLNERTDRRRVRRALTDDEIRALLDATRLAGAVVSIPKRYRREGVVRTGERRHTIPDRATLYALALGTGFRLSELRSLTPRSFNLDADTPTVTVEASYSKRRRRDEQPIRHDLADELRAFLAGRDPSRRLWPDLPSNMAPIIAADLAAAGIASVDDEGRVLDFHSLRHTYCTRLARAGVTPKVAQTLARHSTVTLTLDRYARVELADSADALAALPSLATDDRREAARATGTDGPGTAPEDWNRSKRAAHAQRDARRTGLRLAVRGSNADDGPDADDLAGESSKSGIGGELCASGQSGASRGEVDERTAAARIRTGDLWFTKPLLYH